MTSEEPTVSVPSPVTDDAGTSEPRLPGRSVASDGASTDDGAGTGGGPVPLAVRGVTAAYGATPALWDVSFEAPRGQLVGIIGPNGAGKTTLLKVVMGQLAPVAGRVEVFGRPIGRAREQVGYVPQRSSVDWDFPTTAHDVVEMGTYGRLGWLRRPGAAQRRAAHDALERVGIGDLADRQIGQLSGGQQQRVFLARALAQDTPLYVADEPFAGVDYVTERAVINVLRGLRDEGRTVVVVHHDLASVADYFDSVVLLNRSLVAAGPTATTFTPENIDRTYRGQSSFRGEVGSRGEVSSRGRASGRGEASGRVVPGSEDG